MGGAWVGAGAVGGSGRTVTGPGGTGMRAGSLGFACTGGGASTCTGGVVGAGCVGPGDWVVGAELEGLLQTTMHGNIRFGRRKIKTAEVVRGLEIST